MFVSFQNSHVEIPAANVMLLGGGGTERWQSPYEWD